MWFRRSDRRPRVDLGRPDGLRSWRDLAILAVALLLIGALLRYAYPFALVTGDSGSYVAASEPLLIGSYRPVGYSAFLRLVHDAQGWTISQRLFWAQYLLSALSLFALYASLRRLLPLSRISRAVLLVAVVFNPCTMFLTICMMSDSLFHSLAVLLATAAVWVILRGSPWMAALLVLALVGLLFTRYGGLVFPAVATLSFLCAPWRWRIRLPLAVTPLLIAGSFYAFITKETHETVGIRQFSAFSGWQLINNALHVLPHVEVDPEELETTDQRYIHTVVTEALAADPEMFPRTGHTSFSLMWRPDSPLKEILYRVEERYGVSYFVAWSYVGLAFRDYGRFLIERYPLEYGRYFLAPNSRRFFWPSVDVLGGYPAEQPADMDKHWLGLPGVDFGARFDPVAAISRGLPVYHLVLVLAGLAGMVGSVWIRWGTWTRERRLFWWLMLFGLSYAVFTVFASPVSLRIACIGHLPIGVMLAVLLSRATEPHPAKGPAAGDASTNPE